MESVSLPVSLEDRLVSNGASKRFEDFMNRGVSPCDYERQLVSNYSDMIDAIFDGKVVPPYEVEIQPSSSCNLFCEHCFGAFLTSERLPNRIDDDAMYKIINEISGFRDNGFSVETVKFCGTTGEPLVNSSMLYGIELLKKIGKRIIVFTNGLNLDLDYNGRQYLDYVLDANKLNLSLDSGCEETFRDLKRRDGFGRIIKSLGSLVNRRANCESDLNIVVSYVVGKKNYFDIVSATKLMKNIGVDEMRFRVDFTDVEHVRDLSGVIIDNLKEAGEYSDKNFIVDSVYSDEEIGSDNSAFNSDGRKCFNQHFWACVGPDANLYACGHRTYAGVRSYGSLLDNSFRDLWLGEERVKNLKNLPDECCKFCSPSSSRRNDFMTFLSGLEKR